MFGTKRIRVYGPRQQSTQNPTVPMTFTEIVDHPNFTLEVAEKDINDAAAKAEAEGKPLPEAMLDAARKIARQIKVMDLPGVSAQYDEEDGRHFVVAAAIGYSHVFFFFVWESGLLTVQGSTMSTGDDPNVPFGYLGADPQVAMKFLDLGSALFFVQLVGAALRLRQDFSVVKERCSFLGVSVAGENGKTRKIANLIREIT